MKWAARSAREDGLSSAVSDDVASQAQPAIGETHVAAASSGE